MFKPPISRPFRGLAAQQKGMVIIMEKIASLTVEDIAAMNYNELIGLTRETNRTPGGLETIKEVSRRLMLDRNVRILDIGTSTGHSAIEFSRLLGCKVVGIDINSMSIAVAAERARLLKLDNLISFRQMDATDMDFEDETFDVVFAGNVASLIEDKQKLLSEYWRVLKPNGFLVAVPMYYLEAPSDELLNDVRSAIRVQIQPYYKADWRSFFLTEDTELYEELDYRFVKCQDAEIDRFCDVILAREHLKELAPAAMELLHERYIEYMHLFNENLSHMGFTIFALRRKENEKYNDPQLYFSKPI